MKTLICLSKLIFLTLILVTALQAQNPIPNPGFEEWTGGEPVGWLTTNFPPLIVNVTQTNNSHSGNWAVKGEVIDVMFPIPPILNTGSQTSPGFTVNERIESISGYYQLSPLGDDHFFVAAEMGIATTSDTTIIGSGAISIGDEVSVYTQFSFDIDYFLPGEPNWANIMISIIDPSGTTSGHIGSTMWVDGLELIVVGVDDSEGSLIVKEFMLEQNYPNPFNPTTKINFQIPELSFVTLKVFDVLGNEIMTLANEEKPAGTYEIEFNASSSPSGVYFYQLQAGEFTQVKKMILLK